MEQINITLTRKCNQCPREFILSGEFWNLNRIGELKNCCKICDTKDIKYREEHRKEAAKKTRLWKLEHPRYTKEYRQNNRDKVNKLKREYREKHKDEINARERQKRKDNPQAYKKYAENSKGYHNEWAKNKRKNDPNFRLRKILGSRLRSALKGTGHKKDGSIICYLGCDIEFARKHLESQFTEGMSWETHGKVGWHIDHIIPCDAFDLTDESQKYICFNWINLQPLWYDENSAKNNKMPNGKYLDECTTEELNFYINKLKEKIK